MFWRTMLTGALACGICLGAPHASAQETAAEQAPHAAEHEHEIGHGNATPDQDSPAEFRTDLAIYTFVVFMLLLAILGRAAWPSISVALLEREKRIEGNLAAAAAKHEEAKRLLAEHEARLASAAAEIRSMLEQARKDAEKTKDQIVAEAREAADQERKRAIRDIDLAADSALKNLAEKSANLAVELAGKVLRETITPAKQAELVRSAMAKLNASSPSKN